MGVSMNKKEQIEEMAKNIEESYRTADKSLNNDQTFADVDISHTIAEHLYNIGYRKTFKISQTDKEKAKKLIEKLDDAYDAYYDTSRCMPYDLDQTLRESKFLIQEFIQRIRE